MVFGRERHLGGLSRKAHVEAEDASSFFERKEELEKMVARLINEEHEREKEKVNQHRKIGHEYRVGDRVWVAKSNPLGGHKLNAWWMGPYTLVVQKGQQTFTVQIAPHEFLDVHTDQLKPWTEELVDGEGIPLFYCVTDPVDTLPLKVGAILAHRMGTLEWEFLTRWQGAPAACDSWEPASRFVRASSPVWQSYCQTYGVRVCFEPRP